MADRAGHAAPQLPQLPQDRDPTMDDATTLDAPDPDEDDLDDLDDMLDDFSTVNLELKKPAEPSGPGRLQDPDFAADMKASGDGDKSKAPGLDDMISDDEFAKQLEASMADLIGQFDTPEIQEQLKSVFEELGSNAAGTAATPNSAASASASTTTAPGPDSSSPKPPPGSVPESDPSFQSTINDTIRRLQQSNRNATEQASQPPDSEDFMAEMLKHLQESGGADGAGNDEDFSKLLLGMMEELTNKEILYEPMKELDDRFPKWIEQNKTKVSEAEMSKYEEQRSIVRDIVAKFDSPTYKDENASDREYIVERMQKMQAAGAPPPDLVGDMSSAQEMLNMNFEEGCNTQ